MTGFFFLVPRASYLMWSLFNKGVNVNKTFASSNLSRSWNENPLSVVLSTLACVATVANCNKIRIKEGNDDINIK